MLEGVSDLHRALLTDPQTSGGLLVACTPDAVDSVLKTFHDDGFAHASVIGQLAAGSPTVHVVTTSR